LSTDGFNHLKNIPQKTITLEKKDFIIPEKYGEVVPFMN
jgi:hypothetical protein